MVGARLAGAAAAFCLQVMLLWLCPLCGQGLATGESCSHFTSNIVTRCRILWTCLLSACRQHLYVGGDLANARLECCCCGCLKCSQDVVTEASSVLVVNKTNIFWQRVGLSSAAFLGRLKDLIRGKLARVKSIPFDNSSLSL